MDTIVVVGGGQAGAALTARLRAKGFDGTLILAGDEGVMPYQRPPLSKSYLMETCPSERLFLRADAAYETDRIDMRMASPAQAIDRKARRVLLGEDWVGYDALALVTGAEPRRLPDALGGGLDGVMTLRAMADADALRPRFERCARLLVVGGGYIGLEAAAVAASKGVAVTLVEQAPRILSRVASQETADYFRALHREEGVDLREETALVRLHGTDGAVAGAELSCGTVLEVDLVVVGIGVTPRTDLADAAGLDLDNGIATDARGRTSDPAIWAAGDCASFPYRGTRVRLESVQNAIEQAEAVAENILGAGQDYDPLPWFWSDQFDVKLQIAGLSDGHDRVVVRLGEGRTRSHWSYRDGALIAVDAMNDPRAFMTAKRLLSAGKSPDPVAVGDPETALKALLA